MAWLFIGVAVFAFLALRILRAPAPSRRPRVVLSEELAAPLLDGSAYPATAGGAPLDPAPPATPPPHSPVTGAALAASPAGPGWYDQFHSTLHSRGLCSPR